MPTPSWLVVTTNNNSTSQITSNKRGVRTTFGIGGEGLLGCSGRMAARVNRQVYKNVIVKRFNI